MGFSVNYSYTGISVNRGFTILNIEPKKNTPEIFNEIMHNQTIHDIRMVLLIRARCFLFIK